MKEKQKVLEATVAEIAFFLGRSAIQQKEYKEAEEWLLKSLAIWPDSAQTHQLIMYAKAHLRKFKEAIYHSNRAEVLDPGLKVKYMRSLFRLYDKDYIKGFEEFESRFKQGGITDTYAQELPQWDGRPCKTLHVYGDQVFGDVFMFSRYLPLLKEKGVEKVYFDIRAACADLFRYNLRHYPEIEVVTGHTGLEFDYSLQLMSSAHVFKTTYDTVPPPLKFEPQPEFVEKWKEFYKDAKGFKVAVVFEGGHKEDKIWNDKRSVDRKDLLTALSEAGVGAFFPLQIELQPDIKSWSDTAALISLADLTVTIDSGPVHLAASMDATKTFVLNSDQCCWRWCTEGDYTPWYPGIRQFRQDLGGNWDKPIAELKEAVKCRILSKS